LPMTEFPITAGSLDIHTGGDNAAGVVLIHALGRSRWSMWLLARRLRAAGWRVAMVAYPSLRLSIEAASEWVAREVARVSGDWVSGRGRVHLVGHSLGGVIARRLALTRPDLDIARVAQIGAPNRGSSVGTRLAGQSVVGASVRRVLGPVWTWLQRPHWRIWPQASW
jgi:pimeloyl-ACP methyl ester carboxylesterase